MHHLTLWSGQERSVVLAGIATIQWESAQGAMYARTRLRQYMEDLVEWAREEVHAGTPAATVDQLEIVKFGRNNFAKFLFVRQAQLTIIFFLDALLREPEQPYSNFTEARH
jgi:hypothetical protein